MTLYDSREKLCDACEMCSAQFMSKLQEELLMGLKEMRREQVQQVLQEAIGTAWSGENDKQVNEVSAHVLLDNMLSIGFLNGVRYVQEF